MKQEPKLDLVGIGRAFTDIVAHVDEQFLHRNNLPKGRGVDVSTDELIRIRSQLEHFVVQPGGSASNTVAGVAALGGKAAFFGKICDDATGQSFRNAFRQSTVLFPSVNYPPDPGAISATCLILMLKDGPVTIVNARGVADKIKPDDIYSSIIEESVSLLIAGEMLISPDSQTAALAAIDVALMAKRKVAISLNNMYFGSGHKILLNADFLFGNLKEFQHNFPSTEISELRNADLIYIITNGSNGAYISGRGNYIEIPAIELVPNEQTAVPSYVGAGDQFAAGFLFGYAHGLSFSECGKLGAETATAIMRAPGARPSGDWTSLASKYLLPEDKDRNSALSSAGAR